MRMTCILALPAVLAVACFMKYEVQYVTRDNGPYLHEAEWSARQHLNWIRDNRAECDRKWPKCVLARDYEALVLDQDYRVVIEAAAREILQNTNGDGSIIVSGTHVMYSTIKLVAAIAANKPHHRETVRVENSVGIEWRYAEYKDGANDDEEFKCGWVWFKDENGTWHAVAYPDSNSRVRHYHTRDAAISYVEKWCAPQEKSPQQ